MLPSSENRKVRDVWKYLETRFGVTEDDLEGFKIIKVSGDFWLTSDDLETELDIETMGFRFVRVTGRGLKPTTYGLQFLDSSISKNLVELDRPEFLKLLRREEMVPREMENEGYVALSFEGQIVGCGFYKGEKVSSRIPKGRGKELAGILTKE